MISQKQTYPKRLTTTQRFKRDNRKQWIISFLRYIGIGVSIAASIGVITLLIKGVTFYTQPLEKFGEFTSFTHSGTWKGDQQLHVGLWMREPQSPTFRNGLLVIKPDVPSAHIIIFPQNVSVKNPQQLGITYALPVDRYIVAKKSFVLAGNAKESLENLKTELYTQLIGLSGYVYFGRNLTTLQQLVYSDLSPRELLSMYQLIRSIREQDVTVVDWSDDIQERDHIKTTILQEDVVTTTSPRLWVRNTTTTPGLASQVAEFAENIGFDIVRIDNAECAALNDNSLCTSGKTTILTSQDLLLTRPIERLKSVLNAQAVFEESDDLKRADVIIYVGSDFEEMLQQ